VKIIIIEEISDIFLGRLFLIICLTNIKKSNTNFVSCIIVVMSLTLENIHSKSLKFN